MAEIKAIDTLYNGYRFRSRLEARWAVFFDAVGIKYEYEPEGYETPKGRYLPDFYLPELDTHVEVKADRKGAIDELKKAASSIFWGSPIKRIIVLSNIPNRHDGGLWYFPVLYWNSIEDCVDAGWWYFDWYNRKGISGSIETERYFRKPWSVYGYEFEYPRSTDGIDGISIKAVSERVLCKEIRIESIYDFSHGCIPKSTMHIYEAMNVARKARFEYGETPLKQR